MTGMTSLATVLFAFCCTFLIIDAQTTCTCQQLEQCISSAQQQQLQIMSTCVSSCAQNFLPSQGQAVAQCHISSAQSMASLAPQQRQCQYSVSQICTGANAAPPAQTSTGGNFWSNRPVDPTRQIIQQLPQYRQFLSCMSTCDRSNGTSVPTPGSQTYPTNPISPYVPNQQTFPAQPINTYPQQPVNTYPQQPYYPTNTNQQPVNTYPQQPQQPYFPLPPINTNQQPVNTYPQQPQQPYFPLPPINTNSQQPINNNLQPINPLTAGRRKRDVGVRSCATQSGCTLNMGGNGNGGGRGQMSACMTQFAAQIAQIAQTKCTCLTSALNLGSQISCTSNTNSANSG